MTRNGITGIDHVLIAVRDLEAARMAWTRLGFATSPRGKHLGRGSGNYCIMFEHDYLELFGITGPEPAAPEYVSFLAKREGGMKLAWATADAAGAATALAALGLHPDSPRPLSRQLEAPEGTLLPRFDILALPDNATPGISSFICAHLTPELMRRAPWLDHPNRAVALRGVTVIVPETAPLVAAYERLFGVTAVQATDDVLAVKVGRDHRVMFATAEDFAAMYPEVNLDTGASHGPIAALSLASADLAATSEHLTIWHVEHETTADSRILVPPQAASGVMLELVAAVDELRALG